jgi:SWI/SNF-related matrix-associated actin-dependent regulator of chromatin subfamily A member 5
LKKASAEAARNRWLHRHRHLFVPLLPAKTHFFDNLEKHVNAGTGHIPLHELDEQPSLVKGGQMKDYQVSARTWLYVLLTTAIAPWAFFLGLDV